MSDGEVCIVNIGPRQRRLRLYFGLAALAVGAAGAIALITSDAARWWRLLLVLPLLGAASGMLQYREKT